MLFNLLMQDMHRPYTNFLSTFDITHACTTDMKIWKTRERQKRNL